MLSAHIIRRVFFDYNFQWMNLASAVREHGDLLNTCYFLIFFALYIYTYLFTYLHISQGRVATRLRCGGICSNHLTANFLLNQPVKEFRKSVKM